MKTVWKELGPKKEPYWLTMVKMGAALLSGFAGGAAGVMLYYWLNR